MELTLLSSEAGILQIQCQGDFSVDHPGNLHNPLDKFLGPSGYGGIVLISMAKTDYINSAGVGWLIECHKRFREAGGKLILHSIPPLIRNIFQLLQMHRVLNLAPDEAAALALAKGGRP